MDCRDVQLAILEAEDAVLSEDVAQHVASCSACQDFRRACAAVVKFPASDAPSEAVDAQIIAVCHDVLAAGSTREESPPEVLPFPPVTMTGRGGIWGRLAVAASLLLMGALAGLVTLKFRSEALRTQMAATQTSQPTAASDWFDEDFEVVLLSLAAELLFAEMDSGTLVAGESREKPGTARGGWLDQELLEIEIDLLLESELL